MPIDPSELAPPDVRTLVEQARELAHLAPAASLVQSRSAAALLVRAWLKRVNRRPRHRLFDAVQDLIQVPGLGELKVPLHAVRQAGNAGAHPEQRPHRLPDAEEALEALRALHGVLIAWARSQDHPTTFAPFEPPGPGSWGAICERAVLGADPAAMALMAGELRERAVRWYRNPGRQVARGEAVPDSHGSRLLRDALAWFDRAAAAGAGPGSLRDAAHLRLAELGEEVDRGLRDLRTAAEAGDAEAQTMLGNLYAQSPAPFGLTTDAAQAVRWWTPAAAQDHPTALNNLGQATMVGRGVAQDTAAGRACFERAAALGFHEARVNLFIALLPEIDSLGAEALEGFTALMKAIADESPSDALTLQFEVGLQRWSRDPRGRPRMSMLGRAVQMDNHRALARRATLRAVLAESLQDRIGAVEDAASLLLSSRSSAHREEANRALYQVWRDQPLPRPDHPDWEKTARLVATARIFLDASHRGHVAPGLTFEPTGEVGAFLAALRRVCFHARTRATEDDVALLRRLVPRMDVSWSGRARLGNGSLTVPVLSAGTPCPCGSAQPAEACCGLAPLDQDPDHRPVDTGAG